MVSQLNDRLGMERLVLLELIAEWIHCANLYGVGEHGNTFILAYCEQRAIGRVLVRLLQKMKLCAED
jgi:hypothetical protein